MKQHIVVRSFFADEINDFTTVGDPFIPSDQNRADALVGAGQIRLDSSVIAPTRGGPPVPKKKKSAFDTLMRNTKPRRSPDDKDAGRIPRRTK